MESNLRISYGLGRQVFGRKYLPASVYVLVIWLLGHKSLFLEDTQNKLHHHKKAECV